MQLTEDKVNNPKHYTFGKVECLDAIESALTPEEYRGFLKGQIIKYTWRCDNKGKALEDNLKAEFYLRKLLYFRRDSEESDHSLNPNKAESQVEKVWSFS